MPADLNCTTLSILGVRRLKRVGVCYLSYMSVLRCPLAAIVLPAALTQSKEDAEEPAAEPERLQLSLLPVQHQYEPRQRRPEGAGASATGRRGAPTAHPSPVAQRRRGGRGRG